MARFVYNASLPFGQLISDAVNKLNLSTLSVSRSANAISEMTAEQAVAELGITAEDFTNFRNRLNDIKTTLEADAFQSLLVMFDQG